MNHEKINRFDVDYFKSLNKKDKEKYYIDFVKKTLNKMEKGGTINVN